MRKVMVHSGRSARPGTGSLHTGSNQTSSGGNETAEASGVGGR